MKYIHILLVFILALGFLAFGPQGAASAVGTVPDPNPSGSDSGPCYGGKLQTANAVVYINGELIQGCTAFVQKATSSPAAPGNLKLISHALKVYFSQDVTPQVTVCFPTKPTNMPGQIFKVVGDPGFWIQLPTYQSDGMTCAASWGGGTYGYFGY
jgi:hypothetical protein